MTRPLGQGCPWSWLYDLGDWEVGGRKNNIKLFSQYGNPVKVRPDQTMLNSCWLKTIQPVASIATKWRSRGGTWPYAAKTSLLPTPPPAASTRRRSLDTVPVMMITMLCSTFSPIAWWRVSPFLLRQAEAHSHPNGWGGRWSWSLWWCSTFSPRTLG